MIKIFRLTLALLTLQSCNNVDGSSNSLSNEEETVMSTPDTLKVHRKKFKAVCTFPEVERLDALPKSKSFHMTMNFGDRQNEFERKSTYVVNSLDENLVINKIDDSTFKFFIKPEFSNETIMFDILLAPKKNFVLEDNFTVQPKRLSITTFPDSLNILRKAYLVE